MDQPNFNMSPCKWLDVAKDYQHEILYHLGKANIVANALSHKEVRAPIRDIYLRTTITSLILDFIREEEILRDSTSRTTRREDEWSDFYVCYR